MLKTLVLNRRTKVIQPVSDPEEISDLCAEHENVLWVDVSDPTGSDFDDLAKEFGFHPLAIEDCRFPHQRPKVEEYPGYYFVVLYEAELNESGQLELRELNLFLGANYLVTVHSQPVRAIAQAEKLWRHWLDIAEQGTGLLTYLLLDAIVDEYMALLDQQADRIEDIEETIFGEFQPEALQEIFRLKKQLLYLRRSVAPLREVFNTLLRREQALFARETLVYFQDVFDHLVRVTEMIDTLRDTLSAAVEAYLSVSGHRMNMIMKRLTSISTILMSVTLIAGIYGMNFSFMPELGWRYGYVGALAVMLLLALVLYVYFRKIKWL
ncbi:MAG: magnesium/cobalt transporter CorA [Acidobacteria bacterium]|nr:magnesium/cobalt transporter CorA [Acidobacteriota bacterium]MBI3426718.1 magnesium/cobalt transporter CorA [Acidobacteriota bacterium]